ncbi:MAG: tetratricopeptide repeat protein [Flavobacteriales bacterium]
MEHYSQSERTNAHMKALFTLAFFLVITSASAQVYLREREPYKADTAATKTDSSSFKMMDTHVSMSVDKYFNTELSEVERKKREAAIAFFDNQIKEDSTDLSAYMNRGAYYAELGLHVQAIKDYNKALSIEPNQAIVYYNRALSKARFMYTLDACKDLKKAGELGLEQSTRLMVQKCGRYTVELGLSGGSTAQTTSK